MVVLNDECVCGRFVFEWWLVFMLLPLLRPGQVVVMDNASFHRMGVLATILTQFGVHLLCLPPSSPVPSMWWYIV